MPFPSSGDLPDPGTIPMIVSAARVHTRRMSFAAPVCPSVPQSCPLPLPPVSGSSRSHTLHLVATSLWSSLIWECPQPFCLRTLTFRSLGHLLECSTAWFVCFLVMRFRLEHWGEDMGEWCCVLLIRAPQEARDHGLSPWQRGRVWSLGSRRACEIL